MLLLTSITDLINLVTSAASNITTHASYVDASGTTITPARTNLVITTAATTAVVPSPAAATQRNVKALYVANTSASVSCTVEAWHTDGTVAVKLMQFLLLPGESMTFDEGVGWRHRDATGSDYSPVIGAFTTINGNIITQSSGTLTLAAGKTLTASRTLTLTGTDGVTLTFPATDATIARTDAEQTFTGLQTFGTLTTTGNVTVGGVIRTTTGNRHSFDTGTNYWSIRQVGSGAGSSLYVTQDGVIDLLTLSSTVLTVGGAGAFSGTVSAQTYASMGYSAGAGAAYVQAFSAGVYKPMLVNGVTVTIGTGAAFGTTHVFSDAGLVLNGAATVNSIVVGSSAPASASASGIAGTITWDANYVYVCTATNTWKRVAIATW